MTFNKKLKGFTLVEMLIVIVIIGVLAAALIPRLTSVRGRANDVARKADIQQIATAIITYQMDFNGILPFAKDGDDNEITTPVGVDDIADALSTAGMDGVPTDPVATTEVSTLQGDTIEGSYGYLRVEKDGISKAGFVLASKTQTPGGSNRVLNVDEDGVAISDEDLVNGYILNTTDTLDIKPCKSIEKHTEFSLDKNADGTDGDCGYEHAGQLYYIMAR